MIKGHLEQLGYAGSSRAIKNVNIRWWLFGGTIGQTRRQQHQQQQQLKQQQQQQQQQQLQHQQQKQKHLRHLKNRKKTF